MMASPETRVVESMQQSQFEPTPSGSASAVRLERTDSINQEAVDENLYLIGRPTLKSFLRYVKNHAVDPPGEGRLSDEWLAAAEVAATLEKTEAGLADH